MILTMSESYCFVCSSSPLPAYLLIFVYTQGGKDSNGESRRHLGHAQEQVKT